MKRLSRELLTIFLGPCKRAEGGGRKGELRAPLVGGEGAFQKASLKKYDFFPLLPKAPPLFSLLFRRASKYRVGKGRTRDLSSGIQVFYDATLTRRHFGKMGREQGEKKRILYSGRMEKE